MLIRYLFLALFGLSIPILMSNSKKKEKSIIPSDYVPLSDSLFINKYETTNKEYSEFLNAILVDSSETFYKSQLENPFSDIHLQPRPLSGCYVITPLYTSHLAFKDHPVIGTSYQQAINYCQWKTKELNATLDSDQSYEFLVRLPSVEEWQAAVFCDSWKITKAAPKPSRRIKELADSLGLKGKKNKLHDTYVNLLDIRIYVANDYEYHTSDPLPIISCHTSCPGPMSPTQGIENGNGLFHTVGNVSEMTSIFGLAKGLNYLSDYDECYRDTVLNYNQPEAWLGFRTVLELKPTRK